MSTTSRGEPGVAEPSSTHQEGAVEMSTLPSSTQPVVHQTLDEDTTAGAEQTQSQEQSFPQPPPPVAQPVASSSTSNHPTRLTRAQSEALGPATEAPIHPPLPTPDRGPTLSITLMLTTGARHPYKIDEKYLRNRGVDVAEGAFDPREINGYKLKELIWTDWRSEWEPKPAGPSSIRLILLGRFVEDKTALKGTDALSHMIGRWWR